MNPKRIHIRQSNYPVGQTIDIIVDILEGRGVTIYNRINQQAEALRCGLTLGPLELILFGNPLAGVPLMKENPISALDLPLKIISWEDPEKKYWLAYNSSDYIRERYHLPEVLTRTLDMENLIDALLKPSG
jgi:uncharacterized protein (DUF302 family)